MKFVDAGALDPPSNPQFLRSGGTDLDGATAGVKNGYLGNLGREVDLLTGAEVAVTGGAGAGGAVEFVVHATQSSIA